ncbi:MAG: hypothetical protein ABH856_03530 [Patescibacteria group bacterium]
MKLIKISPQYQITIPKTHRHLCQNGWFAMIVDDKIITLRPVEVQEAKTQSEILDEIIGDFKTTSI